MSVIKSKRRLSDYQFWEDLLKIQKYQIDVISRISKRKQEYLVKRLMEYFDSAMLYGSSYINAFYDDKSTKGEGRIYLLKQVIRCISNMQDRLFVLWNIEQYPYRKMYAWADLLNNEMRLVKKMIKEDYEYNLIHIIDWEAVSKAKFVENMCDFHRYIYGKILHVPRKYEYSLSKIILDTIDDALVCVLKSNITRITTKEEYLQRCKLISKAITDLENLEIHLVALFNLMGYSEEIMLTVAEYLTTEIRLLSGVQKSDAERFKIFM